MTTAKTPVTAIRVLTEIKGDVNAAKIQRHFEVSYSQAQAVMRELQQIDEGWSA